MSDPFYKFPSTPHLEWLGSGELRGDKALTPEEREAFLTGELHVEEKIDGANLGLSFSPDGELRFQNRGSWIFPPFRGQWEYLRGWAAQYEYILRDYLSPNLILFGEWCYARHTVVYEGLPDWFMAFDVFDRETERFWSRERRNALLAKVGITAVPGITTLESPTLEEILNLIERCSECGDEKCEGVYLRKDSGDWLEARAKLVNPDFTQTIEEHWSARGLVKNVVKGEG